MWIKLHDNHGVVHVNMDTVTTVRRYETQDYTHLVTFAAKDNSYYTIFAREFPDEIFAKLEEERNRLSKLG